MIINFRNLRNLLLFLILALINWQIIWITSSKILEYSFHSDDWVLLWGVAQQTSILFNPANVDFQAAASVVSRDGYFKVWYLYLLYDLFGLNPYNYFYIALGIFFLASLGVFWAGWRTTNNITAGFISSILFTTPQLGVQSLYWFHSTVNYILIFALCLLIPVFIKGIQSHKKALLISLLLIPLTTFIHPPRIHGLIALPLIVLIWSQKIWDKNKLILSLVVGCIFILSLFISQMGSNESVNGFTYLYGRVEAFSRHGLETNRIMFIFYPIYSLGLFLFPSILYQFLDKNLDINTFLTLLGLIWIFTWVAINKYLRNNKHLFIHLITGLTWIFLNKLFWNQFNTHSDWLSADAMVLAISGIIMILTTQLFYSLKSDIKHSIWVRSLITFLIFTISTYIFNWAYDPLMPPNADYSIGRYLTLPVFFSNLFLGIFTAWILNILWTNIPRKKTSYAIRIILTLLLIIALLWITITQATYKKYTLDNHILIKSFKNREKIITYVNKTTNIGSYPPPVILFYADRWDYGEAFGITMHKGHSFVLWNKIFDPNKFPLIYWDEKTLESSLSSICLKYKDLPVKFYRIRINIDSAEDITDQFKKYSCP